MLNTEIISSDKKLVIAIDAMGGDNAPHEIIKGAELFLKETKNSNVFFKIYGNKKEISPLLENCESLLHKAELVHTSQYVSAEEKPSNAIRNFKESSMQLAINAVKEKEADALLSAGNTGALMAMSTITLRTLPQIHRPAIITTLPAIGKKIIMLDLGANVECDANNLYQFAIMGEAFGRIVLDKKQPVVGLLNIGSEELKGKDSVKLAYNMLKETELPIKFHGYIEGNEISNSEVDVVVTDGFTGNAMLKTIQGYAKVYKYLATQAFKNSLLAKLQFLVARSALKRMSSNLDSRKYNGAMFIGLNGIVVKSHGSSDRVAVSNALKVTYNLAAAQINRQIADEMSIINNIEAV